MGEVDIRDEANNVAPAECIGSEAPGELEKFDLEGLQADINNLVQRRIDKLLEMEQANIQRDKAKNTLKACTNEFLTIDKRLRETVEKMHELKEGKQA